MKKFVSLLLAFSLALCLAACGGSASSAVSGSAASSEAASSEAASSEAAQELSTTDALRIAGLKGPTTMGLGIPPMGDGVRGSDCVPVPTGILHQPQGQSTE